MPVNKLCVPHAERCTNACERRTTKCRACYRAQKSDAEHYTPGYTPAKTAISMAAAGLQQQQRPLLNLKLERLRDIFALACGACTHYKHLPFATQALVWCENRRTRFRNTHTNTHRYTDTVAHAKIYCLINLYARTRDRALQLWDVLICSL